MNTNRRVNRRVFAVALMCAGMAACGDKPSTTASAPAAAAGTAAKGASQAPTPSAIAAETKGFTVGSEMNVRRVFVFFDPQCPHCAALWQAAKPLRSQARFIWIPVGLLNPNSTLQGATLLAAANPVEAMDQHEASLSAKTGGIKPADNIDAQKQQIAANTAVMNKYGFASVPTIVANHAVTGEVVVKEGSMPTAALAAALGLQVPN